MPRKLTDVDIDRIVRGYQSGAPTHSLAVMFRVRDSTIRTHLQRAGVIRGQDAGAHQPGAYWLTTKGARIAHEIEQAAG